MRLKYIYERHKNSIYNSFLLYINKLEYLNIIRSEC